MSRGLLSRCALACSLLVAAGAAAAPAAANATAAAAPAGKVGEVGEPCAQGGACVTGICLAGKCVAHDAACAASAALPASGCVGNTTAGAQFAKIECNDATDAVATNLKLAEGLGSTINSTDCYSNGAAACVVLRDSAALVHYGAQCPGARAASGAAAAGGRASAFAAAAGAAAAAAVVALL